MGKNRYNPLDRIPSVKAIESRLAIVNQEAQGLKVLLKVAREIESISSGNTRAYGGEDASA